MNSTMKEDIPSEGQDGRNQRVEVGDFEHKPSLTYLGMIVMVLQDLGGQGSVQQIFDKIMEKFPYYRNQPNKQWMNGIRSRLSLTKEITNEDGIWKLSSAFEPPSRVKIKKRKQFPLVVSREDSDKTYERKLEVKKGKNDREYVRKSSIRPKTWTRYPALSLLKTLPIKKECPAEI